MKRTEKEKKFLTALIISGIGLGLCVIGILILVFTRDDEGDATKTQMAIFMTLAAIAFIFMVVLVVAAIYLATKQLGPGLKYIRDKEYHNDFNLRMYACKNGRYIHKILSGSKHRRLDYRDYEYKILHDYPLNFFNEIYGENSDERIDDILDIIDSRAIDTALFFEVRTIFGFAYVYIDMDIKKYGMIVLDSSEAKRRDEVNGAKKRLVLENDRIIEEMDKIFDEVEEKKRFYKVSFDENLSIGDIIIQIKDIVE